ncbi:MAG: T9SS type A sorting domain-containing protein [Candidatus Marinimicrobia bacterium]|nr:T9SS type A sorting domain-containing protein [Candidatus Neomarinimicrobiota bacterium]
MKQCLIHLLAFATLLLADYPDQQRVIRADSMWSHISSNSNIIYNETGSSLQLAEGTNTGYFTLVPDTIQHPFDRGLPSWNGLIEHENSGFKVSMRFKSGVNWSPWLTVGYWKNYIWPSYGSTSYSGGYIDYDYVKLNDFHTIWQWRVEMKRQATGHPSPAIDKLSFFVSDERTTDNLNYSDILNDDPPAIFYPTTFICQYNVDPEIGGSICSPTSTVFAIRSFDVDVDAYDFAVDNYDDYWNLFGIWPRAVQNATGYHMDGAVTRYRTWSDAYDVLANNGRIVISVGQPLYSGHLMMLAGFNSQGNPIVHDPARQNGYAYVYSKYSLSHSWFDKGGVSYTFFMKDTTQLAVADEFDDFLPNQAVLYQNYPNPFNPNTSIRFNLLEDSNLKLGIYDVQGKLIQTLIQDHFPAGDHRLTWNARDLAAGIYFIRLETGAETIVRRMTLLK